jgi:adenylosuccinate lyase
VSSSLISPLSPLDGRYSHLVADLADVFSEHALNRTRLEVEIEWFITLTDHGVGDASALEAKTKESLRALVNQFDSAEGAVLKAIEDTTQHDVKAVEYYLREKLVALGLGHLQELTHFAATSEDINNLSYALMVKRSVHTVWLPAAQQVHKELVRLARAWRSVPMLAKTHGQPATPTTFGKEIAVFAHRLAGQLARVEARHFPGKFNGATGTYSAHEAAWPQANWPAISQSFVEGLGLTWNPLTTQIEPHDGQVELFQALQQSGRVAHNLCTDIWSYISMGYLRQIPVAGTTGSSTMPHKINPIRFENAEANLEVASGLFDTLAQTLSTSRLQRDLTDSSMQRTIGMALGHQMVAWKNILRGLGEVDIDADTMAADLEANQEVLAEAIQSVIRAEIVQGHSQIDDPYDVVKGLTRGVRVTPEAFHAFIESLDISAGAKTRLLGLTPHTYVGLADSLVDYLED